MKPSDRYFLAGLLALFLTTLFARMVELDHRPMHGDEANQGVKAGRLLEGDGYTYDPKEHHGPTLYYLALIPARLTGKSTIAELDETTLRSIPALFSAGLILILLPLRGAVSTPGVLLAGLFTLVATPFSFYGRYFIQETLLVFFTATALAAGWRYYRKPRAAPAAIFGSSLGLMHASKETAVIAYFSMAVAVIGVVLWERKGREALADIRASLSVRHVLIAMASGAAISMLLFSSFFTHPRGVLDSILTYASYLQRADGAGLHEQPWYSYLETLGYVHRQAGPWWSQGFVLVGAALGVVVAIVPRLLPTVDSRFLRFLLLYTASMTAVYSVIPYKTPWTLLSFYHGMILLAGIGFAGCIRWAPGKVGKVVAVAFVLTGALQLAQQTYRAESRYSAHVSNPWVYAHTSSVLPEMTERVHELAALHPDGADTLVRVIQPDGDYWPLPWYLRDMGQVGYWPSIPEAPDAPMLIVPTPIARELQGKLLGDYQVSMYSLRPNVLRYLFVERTLWDAYMAAQEAADGP